MNNIFTTPDFARTARLRNVVKTVLNDDQVFDLPKPQAGNTMVYVVSQGAGVDSSGTALVLKALFSAGAVSLCVHWHRVLGGRHL